VNGFTPASGFHGCPYSFWYEAFQYASTSFGPWSRVWASGRLPFWSWSRSLWKPIWVKVRLSSNFAQNGTPCS
jgi:hypothetical protein